MNTLQILSDAATKQITPETASELLRHPEYRLNVDDNTALGIWVDTEPKDMACMVVMPVLNKVNVIMDRAQVIPLDVIAEIHDRFIKGPRDENSIDDSSSTGD